MPRRILLLLLITLLPLQVCAASEANDFLIIPGERVGPITADSSEAQLRARFGAQLISSDVEVGEGFIEPGSTLYPDEPSKRLYIVWNTPERVRPRYVRISDDGSLWKTGRDIGIGSDLKSIERHNGGPFRLLGFGWDYSGSIYHADGGRLSELGVLENNSLRRTLQLRLIPTPEQRELPEYGQVMGDRVFSSGHPAMQRLNPRVYEIIVPF